MDRLKFYEFFAGGGMARIGLGDEWECLFANDFSPRKAKSYRANFPPADEFREGDVFDLKVEDLPPGADLAWASFPCQDLSLAGNGNGLNGRNSGSFWGFWRLMTELVAQDRPVPVIVLENVVGTISIRGGKDFEALLSAMVEAGYRVGPMIIDAAQFVPQSRPRLFILAVHQSAGIPEHLMRAVPDPRWHPPALDRAYASASYKIQSAWIWWHMAYPPPRPRKLADLLESDDSSTLQWHTTEQTERLIELMAPQHKAKLLTMQRRSVRGVGTVYRRIREHDGVKQQRAELRTDEISGCLRTGSGGSSKQFLLIVEGQNTKSRILSSREVARLMGVPETYVLPEQHSEAYHLMGDGLVVPVVNWLSHHLLIPLLGCSDSPNEGALPTLSIVQRRLLERKSEFGAGPTNANVGSPQ